MNLDEEKIRINTYLSDLRMRQTQKYKCVCCGKDGITWNDMFSRAYVINNEGEPWRLGDTDEYIQVCSEECRKKCVRDTYNFYNILMQGVDIPKRYHSARYENIDDRMKPFFDKWIENPTNGLWISGGIGNGKTYLVCSLAYELRKREQSVYFVTATDLFTLMNGIGYNIDRQNRFIKFFTGYNFLIIDDFGIHEITRMAKELFSSLINHLYNDNKAIILTTNEQQVNEKGSGLLDQFEKRVGSRIREMTIFSECIGKDLRVNGAE